MTARSWTAHQDDVVPEEAARLEETDLWGEASPCVIMVKPLPARRGSGGHR